MSCGIVNGQVFIFMVAQVAALLWEEIAQGVCVNCSSMEPDTDISFVVPLDKILEKTYLDNITLSPGELSRRVSIAEMIEHRVILVESMRLGKSGEIQCGEMAKII